MNNLRNDYCKGIAFTVSEPVVPFRETVVSQSNQICLAKSPNKHNRLYVTAEPLSEELVTMEGGLCGEPMRGIQFNIKDVVLHADNIHRGGGQIIPTAMKVLKAAQYTAEPSLAEPVFEVNITVPDNSVSPVYNVVSQRRGEIFEQTQVEDTPMQKLKAYLPVMESFGFDALLRSETSGKAFSQCSFSHWQLMSGNMEDNNSKLYTTVREVRLRKGKKAELPPLSNFIDKL
jgi:elongation factor 2